MQLVRDNGVDEVVALVLACADRDRDLHQPELRRGLDATVPVDEDVVAVLAGIDQDWLQDPALLDRVLEPALLDRVDLAAGVEALLDHDPCQRYSADGRGRHHSGCLTVGHFAFPFISSPARCGADPRLPARVACDPGRGRPSAGSRHLRPAQLEGAAWLLANTVTQERNPRRQTAARRGERAQGRASGLAAARRAECCFESTCCIPTRLSLVRSMGRHLELFH